MFNKIKIDVDGFMDSCPKDRYNRETFEAKNVDSNVLIINRGLGHTDSDYISQLPSIPKDYYGFIEPKYYDGYMPMFKEVCDPDIDKTSLSKEDRDLHEIKYGWLDTLRLSCSISTFHLLEMNSVTLKVIYTFLPYICELAFRNNCYTLNLNDVHTTLIIENIVGSIETLNPSKYKKYLVNCLRKYCMVGGGQPYSVIKELKITDGVLYIVLDKNQRINDATKLYIR